MKRQQGGELEPSRLVSQQPEATADEQPAGASRLRGLFAPVLAPVLRDRRWSIAFAVVAMVQMSAGYFGFRTFDCPMIVSTGVPCPGCGLSRACGALLRGDWGAWLGLHPFAPLFIVAALMIVASLPLTPGQRERFAARTAEIESRFAVVPITIAAMVIYWIVRLV